MNDTTSSNFLPTTAPPGAQRPDSPDAQRSLSTDASRSLSSDTSRVTLAWTDPEDGGTLWIELWGSPALVAELVDHGFALQDEPRESEFLELPFLTAPASSAGAHLRARIVQRHPTEN
jgi:hypothetical protein